MAQQQYVSTDPNFGLSPADKPPKKPGTLAEFVELVAKTPPPPSVFSGTPLAPLESMGRSMGVDTLRALTDPVNNAGTLLAMAAQMVPPLRAASVASKLPSVLAKVPRFSKGMDALKSVLFGARRSAAGGGIGGGITAAASGEDPLKGAVSGAATEGGLDLLTGGGMTVAGQGARGVGRQLAYRAMSPDDTTLAAIHAATQGTPEGYRTLPHPFIPSATRSLLKDELEREATSGAMRGSFGSTSNAEDAIIRADISDALQENIIRQTLQKTNNSELARKAAEAAARRGGPSLPAETQFEEMWPKGEYSVNLSDATVNARKLAEELGQMGKSADPLGDRATANRAIDRLLAGEPDRRMRATSRPLLTEGTTSIPLATPERSINLEGLIESLPKAGDVPVAVPAPGIQNADAIRLDRNRPSAHPNTTDWTFSGPVTADELSRPSIGTPQTAIAPSSVLPRPTVFTGEVPSRVTADLPVGQQGTMRVTMEEARRLLGEPPSSAADHTNVGFDRAVETIRSIDRKLQERMQEKLSAMGRSENYVPGPDEMALMRVRGQLRDMLNRIAPTTPDLSGSNTLSLADVLGDQRRDIIMRDMKVRATGEDVGNIRARMGYNPNSGRPSVSLFENLQRFGGTAAAPLMRAGSSTLESARTSPQLARLLWLLSRQPDSVSAPMDAPGVRR